MVRLAAALSLILLLALVAGCLDDTEDPTQDPGAQTENEARRLVGKVVDSGLNPIQNAMVVITQDTAIDELLTDENGGYESTPLPEGLLHFEVLHDCCHPHIETVRAPDSGMKRHDITLEPRPSQDPHVEPVEWNGFISCGFSLGFSLTNSCGDPNHNVTHHFEGHEGLRSIVVAMDWETTGLNPKEDLRIRLESETNPTNWYTYRHIQGTPPLEFHVNATGHGVHNLDEIDEEPWNFRFRVRPPDTLAYSYQQSFTVWYRLHYWEGADEEASALPDS